jgi:hypothetical protein
MAVGIMAKICFMLPGPPRWASARLRAEWPARYIPDAIVYRTDLDPDTYPAADVYVWIKVINRTFIEQTRERVRHYWDVCDPTWWWNRDDDLRGIISMLDGVIASNKALADDLSDWAGNGYPCYTIPDRLELEHFPIRKTHLHSNPVRFIWYGSTQNRIALFSAIANLERLTCDGVNIELTIFDDHPENPWGLTQDFPVYFVEWKLDQENQVIAGHDIALLPPYPGAWGRVKSNNKALTAWACGLPVTDAQDYKALFELTTIAANRERAADLGYKLLCKDYLVEQSARDWMELLNGTRSV